MASITLPSHFEKIADMAEAARSYLTQSTLVPLSLVITIMGLVAGTVISHTTLTNKVDRLEIGMSRIEDRYISKELYHATMGQIQSDIKEIKEILKNR